MKRLTIVIEAIEEWEIISVLRTYANRAERDGCYSSVGVGGPAGQSMVASFVPQVDQLMLPEIHEKISKILEDDER